MRTFRTGADQADLSSSSAGGIVGARIARGLLSVVGGKITGYRSIAEDMTDLDRGLGELPRRIACSTNCMGPKGDGFDGFRAYRARVDRDLLPVVDTHGSGIYAIGASGGWRAARVPRVPGQGLRRWRRRSPSVVAAGRAAHRPPNSTRVDEEIFCADLSWSDRSRHQQHPVHRLR